MQEQISAPVKEHCRAETKKHDSSPFPNDKVGKSSSVTNSLCKRQLSYIKKKPNEILKLTSVTLIHTTQQQHSHI